MDVTRAFHDFLLIRPVIRERYCNALEIIRDNSEGNIWLIGGLVYKGICKTLYGGDEPKCNLDFIVERLNKAIRVDPPWFAEERSQGKRRLIRRNEVINVSSLKDVHSIKLRDLDPDIKHYLSGAPLNIQAIAYDCTQGVVIGDEGIQAIREKKVRTMDDFFAEHAAKKRGISKEELVRMKEQELGFSAEQ